MNKQSRVIDHTGSSFDSFLEEENLIQETEAVALKRVIAFELKAAMHAKHVSKTQMAHELRTSRSQVDRLLDPMNVGVSIGTVAKAARVVEKTFRFEFVDEGKHKPKRSSKARHAVAGVV
ncbi:MAG TPA: hypothetical protein VL156_18080 [Terriglobales bacterium]|jgi:antitoxin HicB|nr:hypothetical protein [Terriglobales bacterium]